MMTFLFVAMLNGVMIGTARTINGQLSVSLGAFRASLWNHIVGLIFLTVILVLSMGTDWQLSAFGNVPVWAYLGGVFGALFVAVSSYIFPRLGAMKAAIFVIAGQMLSAVVIDCLSRGEVPGLYRVLGACLILSGIYLSNRK
ncbi:DMT family transporter [Photobacterium sp. CCB-ST2H9]|uniref:DMT family transporter n=1 Tax=unclassified Photobacterium TaxID=2628852 RepID=UPI0020030572|nr:DMT family transporter [Photobacterium sp. CCB-ST2H9]UTM59646.1 DMT family transporter [Photobacterium sp. CCB-ST2H9]